LLFAAMDPVRFAVDPVGACAAAAWALPDAPVRLCGAVPALPAVPAFMAPWLEAAVPDAEPPWCRETDAWLTGAGSATCSRRPASTCVPEAMPFHRRNSLSETPKRSAIVTKVSPRRAT
jgi:hypothetical protein